MDELVNFVRNSIFQIILKSQRLLLLSLFNCRYGKHAGQTFSKFGWVCKKILATFISLNKFIIKIDPMILITSYKYQYFLVYIWLNISMFDFLKNKNDSKKGTEGVCIFRAPWFVGFLQEKTQEPAILLIKALQGPLVHETVEGKPQESFLSFNFYRKNEGKNIQRNLIILASYAFPTLSIKHPV